MRLVICGGGISGLSSAYYASKILPKVCGNNFKITLLEQDENVGGWMKTRVDEKHGSISEWGPHSFRFSGKKPALQERNSLSFINELDLGHLIMPIDGTSIATKNRLIYFNEDLHKLPSDLKSAFLPSTLHKMPLAAIGLTALFKRVPKDSEMVHEMVAAKTNQTVADLYASAMCRGVFAADSKKLSMKAAFPGMWKGLHRIPKSTKMDHEARHDYADLSEVERATGEDALVRRAVEGDWRMWTGRHGLGHLSEQIAARIEERCPNVEIVRGARVTGIGQRKSGKMVVAADIDEDQVTMTEVDRVISALPSHHLKTVIESSEAGSDGHNRSALDKVASLLGEIEWVDVAVVHVELPGAPHQVLPHLGFGHLVPAVQKSNLLGVIYDSCLFPDQDRRDVASTRLTCMMGGSWFGEVLGDDPHQVDVSRVERMAVEGIGEQLGLGPDVRPLRVNTMICHKCIPTYRKSHTELVRHVEYLLERRSIPLSLVGASYWGVSLNDCIYNPRALLSKIYQPEGATAERHNSLQEDHGILRHSFIYRAIKGIEKKSAAGGERRRQ